METSVVSLCKSRLQIKKGNKDNSEIFFSYFSMKTYIVTPHLNRLSETVLLRGHNVFIFRNNENFP